jgi:hypothetical protein
LRGEGFHAGEYHRLRVGSYRVVYVVEGDLVTAGARHMAAVGDAVLVGLS